MFKEVMSDTIQEMLNGELDDELGYDKYEQSKKRQILLEMDSLKKV